MHMNALSAEAIAPIRARFLAALRDRETRIGEAVQRAMTGPGERLLDDLHKIRGVAPMLGLAELGALAANAEDHLCAWIDRTAMMPGALAAMPAELHDCLVLLHAAICDALTEPR